MEQVHFNNTPSREDKAVRPHAQEKTTFRKRCACVDSTGDPCIRFQEPNDSVAYCAHCLNRDCEDAAGLGHPSIGYIGHLAEHATFHLPLQPYGDC